MQLQNSKLRFLVAYWSSYASSSGDKVMLKLRDGTQLTQLQHRFEARWDSSICRAIGGPSRERRETIVIVKRGRRGQVSVKRLSSPAVLVETDARWLVADRSLVDAGKKTTVQK